MNERQDWIGEVVRCATLAHDGAGMAMAGDDPDLTAEARDSLGRLVTIVEVGIAYTWIDVEGSMPIDLTDPRAALIKALQADVATLGEVVKRVTKERSAMVTVLRAVEWTDERDALRCPCCRRAQDDGHKHGCKLAACVPGTT